MGNIKASYINELYKIIKKKKTMLALILFTTAIIVAAVIVYSVNNFSGIRVTGSSEFSILTLSAFSYSLFPLFIAFICIDMFSGEFVNDTIKFTLTRPASRLKIYTAKTLAIATFIISNLAYVMLLSFIISFFINGTTISILKIITAYTAAFLPLFVFSLVVIVISNISKGNTSAFMLSILAFLISLGLEIAFPYIKSFLFTSLFGWHGLFLGNYINYSKIFRVFLIFLGYVIMFFGIGFYLFDNKDF